MSKSQQAEKPVGQDWMFWKETFQLCRDVPKLLAEIDRLKAKERKLYGKILELKSDYECEF